MKTDDTLIKEDRQTNRWRESLAFLALIFCAVLSMSLISYHPHDRGWSVVNNEAISNALGALGAYLSDFMLNFFGYQSYIIAILAFWFCLTMLIKRRQSLSGYAFMGYLLLAVLPAALWHFWYKPVGYSAIGAGGIWGERFALRIEAEIGMLGGSFLLCALLLLAAIWTTDLALSKLALRWSMSLFNALYRCFNRIFIFCLACLNCWKNLYLVLKQKILARRHSETQIEHLIANDLQDELPTLILDKAWLQHNDQHFQADVHLDNVEKKSRVESQIPSLAPPDVKTIILPQVEAYLELEVGATKRSGQESPLSSSLKTPQNSKHLNGIDTDANTKSHQPPHKTDAKLSISTIDVEVGDWDLSFELYDWERTTE